MGNCKNIECGNKTEGKRVYCSLKCRNYYVNKYLRDYSKNSKGISKEDEYENNPKFCINVDCGKKIPYNKRRNSYCGHSCKANALNKNRKGIKYVISDEGLINLQKSAFKLKGVKIESDLKNINDYNNDPKICKNCDKTIEYKMRNKRIFCSNICRREYDRVGMGEFLKYKADTKFNFGLKDYPDKFNFKLIEEHGWYSPSNSRKPNIGGVSRDHMLSVREGFEKGMDPKLLAHPANCKLMIHSDNISKNKKSSITKKELLERIEEWDNKYGDVA